MPYVVLNVPIKILNIIISAYFYKVSPKGLTIAWYSATITYLLISIVGIIGGLVTASPDLHQLKLGCRRRICR